MAEYVESLRKLADRSDRIYYPTHGAPIENPQSFVRAITVHRKMRESQILDCLDKGISAIGPMVTHMYKGLDMRLMGAAKHSVFAHIIDLSNRGIIKSDDKVSIESKYSRV